MQLTGSLQAYGEQALRDSGAWVPPASAPSVSPEEFERIWVPRGLTSSDGSAFLGGNGHLFLRSGSNDLASQYLVGPGVAQEKLDQKVDLWVKCAIGRYEAIACFGATFLQIIIPEKGSVLHHESGAPANDTPLMKGVESVLGVYPWFISGNQVAKKYGRSEEMWLLYDSHYSALGAQLMLREVVELLGLPPSQLTEHVPSRLTLFPGDLSARVFGFELKEPKVGPPADDTIDEGELPYLLDSFTPRGGKHIGTTREWMRADAPYDFRVLVFGNSFFGTGPSSSRLCWWFSRAFTNFKFVWSPEVDIDIVEEYQPDIVIAQTIERFLFLRLPQKSRNLL